MTNPAAPREGIPVLAYRSVPTKAAQAKINMFDHLSTNLIRLTFAFSRPFFVKKQTSIYMPAATHRARITTDSF